MKRQSTFKATTLAAKNIAMTGSSGRVTRQVLRAALEKAGAFLSPAVTRFTDLLVVGAEPCNAKLREARFRCTPVMTVTELEDLLLEGGLLNSSDLLTARVPESCPRHAPLSVEEQAISNVVMMCMLEMKIGTLLIDDNTRAKVLDGRYRMKVERDETSNGMRFTLLSEDGRDADM